MSDFKDIQGVSMWDLPITEAVYTFVLQPDNVPIHIAASTLRAVIIADGRLKPISATIGESLEAALERGALGVEEDHAWTLPDAALETPALVCEHGSDHIIADGAHRLWRRWKRGDKTFPAYIIPEALWRLFVIYDMPGDGTFWDTFNRNVKVR